MGTSIFNLSLKAWIVFLVLWCGFGLTTAAVAESKSPPHEDGVTVFQIKVTGLERTDRDWLIRYLDIRLPTVLTRHQILNMAKRLMTTGAFREVKTAIEPIAAPFGSYELQIQVEEKWTTIPVLRAAYGGGVPLRVVGAYDTHLLGRLLTLGGEMRQYGTAPLGYVIYARDPRADGGRSYLGAEVWREFRNRQLFDDHGTPWGELGTGIGLVRLRWIKPLRHLGLAAADDWRYGVETEFVGEERYTVSLKQVPPGKAAPAPALLAKKWGQNSSDSLATTRLLPVLLYDDIDLDIMMFSGFRAKWRFGPIVGSKRVHGVSEWDIFGYHLLSPDTNLASHLFVGTTTLNSTQARYFLGGLDSVRGLPDSYLQGLNAAFASVELRQILARYRHVWIQGLLFADSGLAGDRWSEAWDGRKSVGGLGVRIAFPRFQRVMVRIDYAWGLGGGQGQQGLTAGMGQFFDPYPPL